MFVRVGFLLVLMALCVSCGDSNGLPEDGSPAQRATESTEPSAPPGPLRIAVAAKEPPSRPGELQVGVGGSATLANVNGCVGEASKGGGMPPTVFVWPHGTTITSDSVIQLRGRTFKVGDTIVFGHSGLPGPSLDQFDLPDACKSASSVLIFANDSVKLAGE